MLQLRSSTDIREAEATMLKQFIDGPCKTPKNKCAQILIGILLVPQESKLLQLDTNS